MAYKVQDRLRHCSERMAVLNKQAAIYSGHRNGITLTYPLDVSPILMSADELSPGSPSITRVEYQDFGIDVAPMGKLYPPEIGDTITLVKNREKFTLTSIGVDEPPYQHVTSSRERVLVHTLRSGRGY